MSDSLAPATVFVVDDDESMRGALVNLFDAVGLKAECFASAEMFLARMPISTASCLVLDVRLPGVSGLSFQGDLAKADCRMPIIFITAHGDIPMTVRAMKAGAVDFLTKPFRDQELLDSVQLALKRDEARLEQERGGAALRARFERLTPREREIMAQVTVGLMNKQIADKLGIAEITVKIHRGQVMQKMGARSIAELTRMAQSIGIGDPAA